MASVRMHLTAALAALFTLSTLVPPSAEARGGRAKTSVGHAGGGGQRAAARPAGGNRAATADRRPARQAPKARPGGGNRTNAGNANRRGNTNTNVNRRGGNNVVAGNTVVVNHNTDRNYHGGYHDNDWDDDWGHHDGFWENVGEAAVATAAVVGTAAVIGEIFEDEPDNCQQSVHYGQTYLYCNGVWYQPTMAGSDVNYVVVNNPG